MVETRVHPEWIVVEVADLVPLGGRPKSRRAMAEHLECFGWCRRACPSKVDVDKGELVGVQREGFPGRAEGKTLSNDPAESDC